MSLLSQLQGLITALGADIKAINTSLLSKESSLGFTPVNKAGDTMNGPLNLMAGTLTQAPIDIPSAVNLMTNPLAGSVEFDGLALYFTNVNNARGALKVQQIIALTNTNTLISQTGVQPIFDGGGGPTNGSITLPIGTYQYECSYAATGLSATSGSFGFALGGSATKTYTYQARASKAGTSLTTPMASVSTFGTTAITTLVANSTGTVANLLVKGIIRVTAAGTVIPQISLTTASAAVIQSGSYFTVSPLGNVSNVAQLGNVS